MTDNNIEIKKCPWDEDDGLSEFTHIVSEHSETVFWMEYWYYKCICGRSRSLSYRMDNNGVPDKLGSLRIALADWSAR